MHNIFHSFSSFGFIFLTLFSGGHHTNFHTNSAPIVHEIKTHHADNQTITAQGSVSKFGQTVTFTLSFPEKGGKVDGTISGACTGTIQGDYSGENLNGTAQATCPIFLATITGTAIFDGHIDPEKKSALLHAKVSAQAMSENIEIPLTLSE